MAIGRSGWVIEGRRGTYWDRYEVEKWVGSSGINCPNSLAVAQLSSYSKPSLGKEKELINWARHC